MPECPKCGEALEPTATHCDACGTDLANATARFTPVKPDGTPAQASDLEGPALFVRKGPDSGATFYLDRDRLTIGRDPDSDIFLNDVTVSRNHAVIERSGDAVAVRDAGSLNGTYVNGAIAEHAELRDGDTVQIGTFQMVFNAPRST